jgi:hypothetical protein
MVEEGCTPSRTSLGRKNEGREGLTICTELKIMLKISDGTQVASLRCQATPRVSHRLLANCGLGRVEIELQGGRA